MTPALSVKDEVGEGEETSTAATHYGTKPGHFGTSKVHFPTSERVSEVSEQVNERSGGCEQSEQSGASERVSGASEQANRRASGPVLTSLFLFVPDHSAAAIAPVSRDAPASCPLDRDIRAASASSSGLSRD